MRQPRIVPLFLLCLFLPTLALQAQTKPPITSAAPAVTPASSPATPPAATPSLPNPKTPAEFFARARQLSDLEAAGIPFHLKTTFVASGVTEFIGNGTFEEWWQSKKVWRLEVTLGSYRSVEIRNGAKIAASATSDYTPLRILQLVLLRIFYLDLLNSTEPEWTVSPLPVATGSPVTVTARPPCFPSISSIRCIEQYTFAANGVLNSYRNNDITETYSDFQPFGKLMFPRKIVVALRTKPMDTMNVVKLEPLTENDPKRFDRKAIPHLGMVPAPLIETVPVKNIHPPKLDYSAGLKPQKSHPKLHPNNLVVVACTIGPNGEVREAFVQRSGGSKLDDTALEEVREAVFKPAKIHRRPVQVYARMVILF